MRFIFLFFIIILNYQIQALDNQRLFPLVNYNQNVESWINSKQPKSNQPILTLDYQNKKLDQLKHRYFGTDSIDPSPWNGRYITSILKNESSISIYNAEKSFLTEFDNTKVDNPNKIGYGLNKRPYTKQWINKIINNLNLSQFASIKYSDQNRAIAVNNLYVRILPTDDPFYYSDKIIGEGYPFDNLQNSAIYTGTPLYIVGSSLDHRWFLVVSPSIIGWVSSSNVAKVDDKFISSWQNSAYYDGLIGFTNNDVSVIDNEKNYLFTAYVGTILPGKKVDNSSYKIMIPIKNADYKADINYVNVSTKSANLLPLAFTPANFSKILSVMQSRAYGWGNLDMYNDCSSELKNIYALFGIFIPRNTKSIDNAGSVIDLSAEPIDKRLSYLMSKGKGLLTLIHINGHVMLYIGNYTSQKSGAYPLVYQQVWGLKDYAKTYKSIIGQSVFFPLLKSYPEDKNLISEAGYSMFKLIYLDHATNKDYKPGLEELLY